MLDRAVFGGFFHVASWSAWRAFLVAVFGLNASPTEATVIRRCTGRQTLPSTPAREVFCVVGRRGGKSRIAALVALYLACFRDYRQVLAPGERGVVMVIASDRRQARVVKRYISGLLHGVPMFASMVLNETAEGIELTNGIMIEIHTASFRSIRGYTCVAAILDEMAFWPTDEAANPDSEIINALRPAMATVPGALLLAISSPYARRGELWRAYHGHFGKDGDSILVWQADTRTMNPTVPSALIEAAYAEDEAVASAEYGAQFRRDIESFVPREAVEACIIVDRRELPPIPEVDYLGFVDPSGGSQDSMTLAIAHSEGGRAVLDLVRERRPPFSPEEVTREFAELLTSYGVTTVRGDRYGGEWPREQFRKHGIHYRVADKPKSDLYRDILPMINSRTVELLDHSRLIAQFYQLERRTARGGRDTIDHAPGGHDDLVNVAAGALTRAATDGARKPLRMWGGGAVTDEELAAESKAAAGWLVETVRRQGYWWPGD